MIEPSCCCCGRPRTDGGGERSVGACGGMSGERYPPDKAEERDSEPPDPRRGVAEGDGAKGLKLEVDTLSVGRSPLRPPPLLERVL